MKILDISKVMPLFICLSVFFKEKFLLYSSTPSLKKTKKRMAWTWDEKPKSFMCVCVFFYIRETPDLRLLSCTHIGPALQSLLVLDATVHLWVWTVDQSVRIAIEGQA